MWLGLRDRFWRRLLEAEEGWEELYQKCIKVLYRAGAKNVSSLVGDTLVNYMIMPGRPPHVQRIMGLSIVSMTGSA